jgi:DNA-binding XRE family transcriptional regulator
MKNNRGRKDRGFNICGKSVKEFRIKSFLSQTCFGKKVGLSLRAIQKIENEENYQASLKSSYAVAKYMIENPLSEKNEQVWNLIKSWNSEKELNV